LEPKIGFVARADFTGIGKSIAVLAAAHDLGSHGANVLAGFVLAVARGKQYEKRREGAFGVDVLGFHGSP
jgi:hypothetical protein